MKSQGGNEISREEDDPKCKRRKESRPETITKSPLSRIPFNLPSRLSHASSAELWSTLYKSEPSSNLWCRCVRIWRRESECKQCYFFAAKVLFCFPLLNVVRNCVKVLSICCCTKFVEVKSEQLNSITYARNTRTNSITLIPPLKIQVAFQIYRVARMYFYHSETNCCL